MKGVLRPWLFPHIKINRETGVVALEGKAIGAVTRFRPIDCQLSARTLKSKARQVHTKGGVIGVTDRQTVKLDLDVAPFKKALYYAKRVNRWFRLEGYLILRSSKGNYHAVFNKPVTWEKNVRVMAWACFISKFNSSLLRWFVMQCVKGSRTLSARAHSYIGPEPSPPASPYVVSQIPAADATNVAITSTVQVTFSEPMDNSSVQNAFNANPTVPGSFFWSSGDSVLTFTPSSSLAYGTLYTVTISTGAKDKEGQNMLSAYSWSFTTAGQTFGKTDIGASVSNLCAYSYGSRYQITVNGIAQSLSLYVQEATGSSTALKVAIYSDSAGVPVTLLAQGTTTVPANYQGWITVALASKPSLSAGGYYWLVADAKVSGKTLRFYYSTGTANQGVYGTTSYASFPANPCARARDMPTPSSS
jgi:hypothetical protein